MNPLAAAAQNGRSRTSTPDPGGIDRERPAAGSSVEHDDADRAGRGFHVVYTAMKPQLRGRFRRNVETLLAQGARVSVLTIPSDLDFHLGLHHPLLRVERISAASWYVRVSAWSRTHAARRAEAQRRRAAEERSTGRWGVLTAPTPIFLLAVALTPLWWLLRPVERLLTTAWRHLPLRVRSSGWAIARRQVRARRRIRQWWRRRQQRRRHRSFTIALRTGDHDRLRRLQRRVLRRRDRLRRRLELRRTVRRWRQRTSRRWVERVRTTLRPWHRLSRFLAFWRQSADRAVELQPDLMVSSDLPGLVGASRAAHRRGIGHLHDCHELYLESTTFRRLERWLFTPLERRHLRRATAVTVVNESIAEEYRRRYGRRGVVVRNCAPAGGDVVVRDLRGLAGLDPAASVVLYQGGFVEGRGLEVCVQALTLLPPEVHLVMLGYGPLREELQRQAIDTGVSDRFHLLEAVPPEELPGWSASATVGLIPYQPVSMNNYLALPNKAFEYTAVGLPIVASDVPELRRVVVDSECGAVYDPYSAPALAEALLAVLEPQRRARCALRSRDYGSTHVWEREQLILVAQIRHALRGSPVPAASAIDG